MSSDLLRLLHPLDDALAQVHHGAEEAGHGGAGRGVRQIQESSSPNEVKQCLGLPTSFLPLQVTRYPLWSGHLKGSRGMFFCTKKGSLHILYPPLSRCVFAFRLHSSLLSLLLCTLCSKRCFIRQWRVRMNHVTSKEVRNLLLLLPHLFYYGESFSLTTLEGLFEMAREIMTCVAFQAVQMLFKMFLVRRA